MRTIVILLSLQIFFSIPSVFSQDNPKVSIETEYGSILLTLYNETPKHRDNFIKLVKDGYYNGQLFHRVIKDFMIQSGDPNSIDAKKGEQLGSGGPGYTIDAEFVKKYFHKRGALSAARKGDYVNPLKESSGSQFYIVQGKKFTPEQLQQFVNTGRHTPFTMEEFDAYTSSGGTPHLDGSYTVFGEITSGFEVLDKIASEPVDAYDRPIKDISINISIVTE